MLLKLTKLLELKLCTPPKPHQLIVIYKVNDRLFVYQSIRSNKKVHNVTPKMLLRSILVVILLRAIVAMIPTRTPKPPKWDVTDEPPITERSPSPPPELYRTIKVPAHVECINAAFYGHSLPFQRQIWSHPEGCHVGGLSDWEYTTIVFGFGLISFFLIFGSIYVYCAT